MTVGSFVEKRGGAAREPGVTAAGHASRSTSSRVYAALDLGTNNCRLLIARPTFRGFRVIDSFSRIVRLGEGLDTSGRISDAAIERCLQALNACAEKMRTRSVTRTRLVATEACRVAENGQDFLSRAAQETGIDIDIVDRATEARLAATGCAALFDPHSEGVVLFDIGGGSTEIVWLERNAVDGVHGGSAIRAWVSLPVGVVTLAERHGGGVRVDRDIFEAMVTDASRCLDSFPHRDALTAAASRLHMVGTSGTVTTIAGLHLDLPRYDRRAVDGVWLSAGDIDAVLTRLHEMTYDERVASPCIGRERADLVMGGCAILEAIRRAFPCARLRVADRGLREGMLVDMMRADGVWKGVPHMDRALIS